MLLLSSITYGFAMLAMEKQDRRGTLLWMADHGLFGMAFVGLELNEFAHLIQEGAGPGAKRLPLGLLHAGRHPRPARDGRHRLDDHPDDPGGDAAGSAPKTSAA